jgi:hypothetical protein
MLMLNMTLHLQFIYNLKNYGYENLNSPFNYVFTHFPLPLRGIRKITKPQS